MAVLFTIDASVFVAAYQVHESHSVMSREFLRLVKRSGVPLIEPAILPVEVAAALARTGSDAARAVEYAESILALPYLDLQPVDEHLAKSALALAANCRLRGADSIYVAMAARYGASLVTLDSEQLKRAPALVQVCKPESAALMVK
jgi:predicted nucleic acid-binding protein